MTVDNDAPVFEVPVVASGVPAEERREAFWDPDPAVWQFRGSSYGGCAHGLVLCLKGQHPRRPTGPLLDRLQAGQRSEERIKALLYEAQVELLDCHSHYSKQRRVNLEWPTNVGVIRISCSLDGWAYSWSRFAREAFEGGVYEHGLTTVGNRLLNLPCVFEHKSVNVEKYDTLLSFRSSNLGRLNPEWMVEEWPTYAWQVSAQSWGLAAEMEKAAAETFGDRANWPAAMSYVAAYGAPILISVEELVFDGVKDAHPNARNEELRTWRPGRRGLWLLQAPPHSKVACADRCARVVQDYWQGHVPVCDSEWECRYGWQVTPGALSTPPPGLDPRSLDDYLDSLEPGLGRCPGCGSMVPEMVEPGRRGCNACISKWSEEK